MKKMMMMTSTSIVEEMMEHRAKYNVQGMIKRGDRRSEM